MIDITEKLLPSPSARRSGYKILGVSFIVAHDTGNDGTTATGNVNYFIQSAYDLQASAHFFVDDKQIIRVIPENEKAWHVQYVSPVDNQMFGKESNDYSLGVELCYSDKKGSIDNQKSYKNYVDLIASLCIKYSLDPKTQIVSHKTLDPSRRTDPINAFGFMKRTWDGFITDVVALMPKNANSTPIATNNIALARQKIKEVDNLLATLQDKI